jgi:hypothetical protein
MTGLPILKWSFLGLDNASLGISKSLIDTAQAPDTEFNEFISSEVPAKFCEYCAIEQIHVNIYEKTYLYLQNYSPILKSLVATAQTPNTIFNEFMVAEVPTLPFFPASQIKKTGEDIYIGDLGFYIG